MGGHKFVFFSRNIAPVSGFSVLIKSANVTVNGSLDSSKRTPQKVREISSMHSYERRVRIFNLGVALVALIVLVILIVWLSAAWMAFEKSLELLR
jgi:hypothetical protein